MIENMEEPKCEAIWLQLFRKRYGDERREQSGGRSGEQLDIFVLGPSPLLHPSRLQVNGFAT